MIGIHTCTIKSQTAGQSTVSLSLRSSFEPGRSSTLLLALIIMWSLIPLLPLYVALLSNASPLGDRALFQRHNGVALSRRFVLSSRFDIPAACAALPSGSMSNPMTLDNSTITTAPPPDNSTVIAPPSTDNSTVIAPPSTGNSTVAGPLSVDNSTVTDNSTLPDSGNSTAADNTTVVRSNGYSDFWDAWFDSCMNSGGDVYDITDPCFNFGLDGSDALLAVSDVCAQQHAADAMVTFAKSRGVVNRKDLINLAISYRKMPRESVEIMGFYPSTPYCTVAPVNEELCDIWNEQPDGVTVGLYGGPNYPIVSFGDDSSCPYGQMPDITTCSCSSNTSKSSGLDLTTAGSDMSVTSAAIESSSTDIGSVSVTGTVADSASATDATSASATDATSASATDATSASATTDAVSSVVSGTSDASTASASSSADAAAVRRRRYL
ncbi:hypothetical protein FB45DRAFT_913468 [Roridomyces roridus]|uniref:Uncharacterized protein n=1 Tax=Roridomyces roridus TaxID=1738132 RepID=A0AAD7FQZ7_9AGAR|nr:hypothetical protein FB45DRAFT_913468 [Roridomyces roridus]